MGLRQISVVRWATAFALIVLLAGCATAPGGGSRQSGASVPNPHFKIGNPYKINGRWYHPAADETYNRTGVASWYGDDFHGKPTANGEIFDMRQMTAAHTTLPMPSIVEVTNLENGRRAVVRVNDRGPFAHDRIIDLSRASARALGFEQNGLANVRVRYLGPAALPGQGAQMQVAQSQPSRAVPKTRYPKQVAAVVPRVVRAPVAAASSPDDLASLIAAADPGRPAALPPEVSDVAPQTAAAPSLLLVRIAELESVDAVPQIRAQLADAGTLRIARIDDDTARYRIHLGPFSTMDEASRHLERVREAGYGGADIVSVSP